ncbi:MAG: hypothetical protein M1814_003484 [Vezdaea aestivalis]|nr:MAG: hypothetical protein M1814_003484 [Vezdaea aestivalis]
MAMRTMGFGETALPDTCAVSMPNLMRIILSSSSLSLIAERICSKLALLGAFITVVALAVDPFTQNIIAVRNCQIPSTNQTALIPTADTYNSWIGGIQRNNTSPNPGDFILWGINRFVPDSDIIASAYSGLFSSATTVIKPSAIRSSCPGINCTFQRYSTLGVCHRCANISSSVETVCSPSPPAQENIFRPRCKWSLPSGQMLQNYTESDNLLNGTIAEVFINFAIANSTASTVALPHVPGTFTNVTILANVTMDPKCTITSENDCGNSAGVPNMDFGPIAFECSLFPCTRTYTASVIGGAIVETEVKRSFGQGNWLNDRGDSSKALSPDKVQINPNEDCTSKWPHKDGSPPPCTYTAGPEFIMSLGNFFWSFWNGTSTGRHYGEATSTNDAMAILYSGGVTNFTHIDRVLGAMADSMTAAIRLTGRVDSDSPVYGRGQGKVEGQVMLADTCIDVRWGWIALPAAVALLTLLLLIPAVVLGRAARSQPAWKSSALAVLFHGLDDTAELASKAPLLTAAEMEKEARGLWVRLSDETGGALRLKTQRRPRIDGD